METTKRIECPKCQATGKILGFSHIASGKCFLCWGARTIDLRAHKAPARIEPSSTDLWSAARGALQSAINAYRAGEVWGTDEDGQNYPTSYRAAIATVDVQTRREFNRRLRALIDGGLKVDEKPHTF